MAHRVPMLWLLDKAFILFHTLLILFNLSGWAWRRTRKANLISLILTAVSWFGLGVFYGIGYCPCTEWHWQIRERLGDRDLPDSYLKFLIDSLTGWNVNAQWVNTFAVLGLVASLVASVTLNIRDFRKRGRAKNDNC